MGRDRRRSARRLAPAAVALIAALCALLVPALAQAAPRVYSANLNSDTISGFEIGPAGAFTPIPGTPFPAFNAPRSLTMSPDASRLYATNRSNDLVRTYSVAASGALTGIDSDATGNEPGGIAISPNGSHVFVSNFIDDSVSVFAVGANGTLAPVVGSPFASLDGARYVAVHPDGQTLYVAGSASDNFGAYRISATGSLTPLPGSPYTGGNQPAAMALTPDGRFLYGVNTQGGSLSGFAVAADGSLSSLTGFPKTVAATIFDVAVTPDGRYLYVPSAASDMLRGYAIGSNGELTAMPGPSPATGDYPSSLTVTPDSRRVIVGNFSSSNLSIFNLATDGSATPAPGSPVLTGGVGTDTNSQVVTPAQGPVAAITADVPAGSNEVQFNAGGSTDIGGVVARYDYDFGDGSTLPGSGPIPVHAYVADGAYTVTVTAIDDEGCSAQDTFTGRVLSCNGNPAATATTQVVVNARVSGAKLRAKRTQKLKGRKVVVKAKASAKEAATVAVRGNVKIGGKKVTLKKIKGRAIGAGKAAKLKLKPESPAGARAILRAVNSGDKVVATVKATFSVGQISNGTDDRRARVKLKG